jgi:hypothetical protein
MSGGQSTIAGRHKILSVASVVLFLTMFSFVSSAQDVRVNAGFVSDSLKIGEPTAFYLAAHYPSTLTILFPDSSYQFTPFEFEKRNYFVTKTDGGISVDSTVYYLTTFEVDRVQHLDLPVFVVQPQDCTVFRSPRDSVFITQLVAQVPDSLSADKLPLKMNTTYQTVFFEFNIWILLIVLLVLILLGVGAWILFGKRISRYFKAKKLVKNHSQFIERYNVFLSQLQSTFSSMTTESALYTWKKYMEQLEAFPYTKLTTKETLNLVRDEVLAGHLSSIDTAIYGHNTRVVESLENLKNFADQRFSKKLQEVKHGK